MPRLVGSLTSIAWLVGPAMLLVGCGDQLELAEIVERLIDEDAEILLAKDDLFESRRLVEWKFTSQAEVAPWQHSGFEDASLARTSWKLRPATTPAWVERACAFDSMDVHLFEVAVAGLGTGTATLSWAGTGETFSAARSAAGKSSRPGGKGRGLTTLAFEVADDDQWRGTIDRLRLEFADVEAEELSLHSVRGIQLVPRPEGLAEAASRAWKIDLDADVRNARLALPGIPIDWSIEVVPGHRLRFSYGLEETVVDAVDFRISIVPEETNEPVVLLSERPGETGRWYEGELELTNWEGQRALLRFETNTEHLLDLAHGFPVWANPELLAPSAAETTRPNIILISLDTLRSDRLSAYGHHRETSPNLDRWAENSAVLFENVVVQGPWTLPSHASMFTGLEALRHDVNHYKEAPASLEMVAETLRRAGYSTAAITGGGYLRPRFGFAQGFDSFRYWPNILAENELAEGMEKLESFLTTHRARPFFLLFHTYETHYPHRRRQPFFDQFQGGQPLGDIRGEIEMRARKQEPDKPYWQHDYFAVKLAATDAEVEGLNEDEKAYVRTQYDSAIAYVDTQLARIFDHLERLRLKGKTLIIVTSDHGEALGESDRAGHNYLNDYNVMVPLVIEFPDRLGAGRKIEQQVRSIDIVPTILDVVGLSPAQAVDGVSLLPLIDGDQNAVPPEAWTYASSSNFGVGLRYRNQLKYVFNNTAWSSLLGREEIYDLHEDPAEKYNLVASHTSVADLREATANAFEDFHQGVRLRIQNQSPGILRGRLLYGWSGHNRVKAIDRLSCDCVSWDGERRGRFELPPDSEITLFFESIPGHRVGLQGRLEGAGHAPIPFSERFDLREVESTGGLEYAAEVWQRVSPSEVGPIGFSIWREGPGTTEPVSTPTDSKLSAQLRALGYVE